jgi:hypothetical protein
MKKAKSLDSAVHNYEVYSKCDDKYAIYANELFRSYYSSVFTDKMTWRYILFKDFAKDGPAIRMLDMWPIMTRKKSASNHAFLKIQ